MYYLGSLAPLLIKQNLSSLQMTVPPSVIMRLSYTVKPTTLTLLVVKCAQTSQLLYFTLVVGPHGSQTQKPQLSSSGHDTIEDEQVAVKPSTLGESSNVLNVCIL